MPTGVTNVPYTLEYLCYDNNDFCQWTVNVDEENYISIHFDTFSIESNYDFLHFGSVDDFSAFGTFSGWQIPSDIVIPNNTVLVTFTSDEIVTREGFVIVFSAVN